MAPCIHNTTYHAHPSHMISVSHTLSSDWVILVKRRRQAVSTSTSCSSMTTVAVQSPRSGGGKNRWSVSAVLRPSKILWSWLIGQVRLGEVRTEWPCVWTWLNRCPCETTLLINTKLFAYAIHPGTVKGLFLSDYIPKKNQPISTKKQGRFQQMQNFGSQGSQIWDCVILSRGEKICQRYVSIVVKSAHYLKGSQICHPAAQIFSINLQIVSINHNCKMTWKCWVNWKSNKVWKLETELLLKTLFMNNS